MLTKLSQWVILCCLAICPATFGEETARLVEQLDGPEFAERQEASRQLREAGKTVFPELEKAAETGPREVVSRAVEILKTHYERGDDETKQAAQASLERLAKCSNASAAQQANNAINPPPPLAQPNLGNIFGGQIRVANGAQIQIQVGGRAIAPGAAPVVRRVHTRTVNGKKEIEVEEGDRKLKIQAFPNGNIEIDITEKQNGKEVTRKVEAKDLEELKRKDVAAAQEYEKYNPTPLAPAAAKEAQLKAVDKQIEQIKALMPQNPNLQRILDVLEQRKKQIAEQK